MPSVSSRQRRFMAAACRGKVRAKISRKVACKFHRADMSQARGAKRK